MEFLSVEELSFVVGVIGNIISVLFFLCPINTFTRIFKDRSTGDFDSFPYICTLLNTLLWTYYGIINPDGLLVATVNGAGTVIEAIYVIIFIIFAAKAIKVKTIIRASVAIGLFVAIFAVTRVMLQGDLRIQVVGIVSAILNVVMYASPLAILRIVLTTRDVEYMPFSLSLFVFLNGGVWTFYAFLVRDLFLGIPNGMGFLLGTAQIVIYCSLNNRSKLKVLEGQGQDEPLLLPPQGDV